MSQKIKTEEIAVPIKKIFWCLLCCFGYYAEFSVQEEVSSGSVSSVEKSKDYDLWKSNSIWKKEKELEEPVHESFYSSFCAAK